MNVLLTFFFSNNSGRGTKITIQKCGKATGKSQGNLQIGTNKATQSEKTEFPTYTKKAWQ